MRITGGDLRSRRLVAPKGAGTRPTADRVREALFSILGSLIDFEGAQVLDLYAGTGALGLEAVSRGAARAVLVDQGREAVAAIRANIASLGVGDRATLVVNDVGRALSTLAAKGDGFDLVLVDPPYADVTSRAAIRALSPLASALLRPGAVVVLEHGASDASPALGGLQAFDVRRYGDTCLSMYARESSEVDRR